MLYNHDDIATKFKIEFQKQLSELKNNKKEPEPTEKQKLTSAQSIAVTIISSLLIFGITIPLLLAAVISAIGLLIMAFKFFVLGN